MVFDVESERVAAEETPSRFYNDPFEKSESPRRRMSKWRRPIYGIPVFIWLAVVAAVGLALCVAFIIIAVEAWSRDGSGNGSSKAAPSFGQNGTSSTTTTSSPTAAPTLFRADSGVPTPSTPGPMPTGGPAPFAPTTPGPAPTSPPVFTPTRVPPEPFAPTSTPPSPPTSSGEGGDDDNVSTPTAAPTPLRRPTSPPNAQPSNAAPTAKPTTAEGGPTRPPTRAPTTVVPGNNSPTARPTLTSAAPPTRAPTTVSPPPTTLPMTSTRAPTARAPTVSPPPPTLPMTPTSAPTSSASRPLTSSPSRQDPPTTTGGSQAPTARPTAPPSRDADAGEPTLAPTRAPTTVPLTTGDDVVIPWFVTTYPSLSMDAGTTVQFVWSGAHDVLLLKDEEAYAACDFEGATYLSASSGIRFALPEDDATLYFACSVGAHCASGQRLTIIVGDGGGPVQGTPTRMPTRTPSPSSSPPMNDDVDDDGSSSEQDDDIDDGDIDDDVDDDDDGVDDKDDDDKDDDDDEDVSVGSTPMPTRAPTRAPTLPTSSSRAPTGAPTARKSTPILDENLFAEYTHYVNPTYTENLEASIETATETTARANLEAMRTVGSAYWIDVKEKIRGEGTSRVDGILEDALGTGELVVFMVYDLPNRDCAADASAGQICCKYEADGTCDYAGAPADCAEGLEEYATTYIDPLKEVLAKYDGDVPMVLVIEPDSLPNLATNLDHPHCNAATVSAYTEGIAYAINALKDLEVAIYLDAGHGGWLGWEDNLAAFVEIVASMDIDAPAALRGFSTNVANYQPLGTAVCPFTPNTAPGGGFRNDYCLPGGDGYQTAPCCLDSCGVTSQYNQAPNELNYAAALRRHFAGAYPGWLPNMVIDTGRNGVPGARIDCSNWCNPRNVGVGAWPTHLTADPSLVDAYYYLKTPGESDGCTAVLPDGTRCPRFDSNCASVDSIGSRPGEPRAPEAGLWFDFQIQMLAQNADW